MWFFSCFALLFLTGCYTTQEAPLLRQDKAKQIWQQQAGHVWQCMQTQQLDQAFVDVHRALKQFPKQPVLHVLAGMLYEKRAESGESDGLELAQAAYQTAANLMPYNGYVHMRLGHVLLQRGLYQKAMNIYLTAHNLQPPDPRILYHLAAAAYYAHDVPVACVSIRKALTVLPKNASDRPLYIRASAMIRGAMGDHAGAQSDILSLKTSGSKKDDAAFLTQRLARWQVMHQQPPREPLFKLQKTATDDTSDFSTTTDTWSDDGTATSTTGGDEGKADSAKKDVMVTLDCVLITLQEDVYTGKGVDLFKAFQDGIFLTLQPQNISKTIKKITEVDGGQTNNRSTTTRTFESGLQWGTLSYNANIMNAGTDRVEVVARPTLSAFLELPAKFSSGSTITGAVSGDSGSTLAEFPTGTRVQVTPRSVTRDMVDLEVFVESSIFTETKDTFQDHGLNNQSLRILKTSIDTHIRLNYNETGILCGNYERSTTTSRTGTPILDRIPLVQYLFSRERANHGKRSILFLLTPRRNHHDNKAFTTTLRAMENRKHFPQLSRFLKENSHYLGRLSNKALLYKENWEKTAYYHRGDVLQLPEDSYTSAARDIRPFLYY